MNERLKPSPARPAIPRRFTLIELLVVIAIIGILSAILLPALSGARNSAKAIASMSNCKQWALAFTMFADDHAEQLPYFGEDKIKNSYSDVPSQITELFWADALPLYVGQEAFADFATDRAKAYAAFTSARSIFCDPAAVLPADANDAKPSDKYDAASGLYLSGKYYYAFQYVPNSKLSPYDDSSRLGSLSMLANAAQTVLMSETRVAVSEIADCSEKNVYNGGALKSAADVKLGRAKGDWQRMGARHSRGLHLTFADGHAAYFKYDYLAATKEVDVLSDSGEYGHNRADAIWNPIGVADGRKF